MMILSLNQSKNYFGYSVAYLGVFGTNRLCILGGPSLRDEDVNRWIGRVCRMSV
uniref:Uncharacterized protein n=1 Tax=Arion vulgaris TaxID=1028688 RepID=A0A0B7BQP5_9EUPU